MGDRPVRFAVGCSVLFLALFTWSAPVLGAPTTTTSPTDPTSTTGATTSTTVSTSSTTVAVAVAASVSVAPSTNLIDLETVTVAGAGLVHNHLVNIAQCNLFNGKSGGVCYAPTRRSTTSDATGAFTTSFVVRRVIVESTSSVDCGAAAATCGIIVGDLTHTVVADLTFDPSAPANPPEVNVAPDVGLYDGDSVHVAGTGFTPDERIVIAQCASTTAGLGRCDPSNEVVAVADEKGSFTATPFVVHTLITVSTGGGTLDCTPTTANQVPCVIVAANSVGASEFAAATIVFAAPAALPRTGGTEHALGIAALAAVAAGTGLVLASRRRRSSAAR